NDAFYCFQDVRIPDNLHYLLIKVSLLGSWLHVEELKQITPGIKVSSHQALYTWGSTRPNEYSSIRKRKERRQAQCNQSHNWRLEGWTRSERRSMDFASRNTGVVETGDQGEHHYDTL
ncbi:hypothetical protein PENTCL1PPCAC_12420, partial [Pristionchus entomophagus]